jgi:hypothetical protein
MRNFFKNLDMDDVKDQIADIKEQMQDIRFRKPWTNGSETTPAAFMAIGAAIAFLGMALYRNRTEVANFCSNCGAELKGRWENSGMKDKTEKFINKVKSGVKEARDQGQDRFQPT